MHTAITTSDALAGLRAISIDDYSDYANALEASRPTGSSYYLPGLLAYHRTNRREILLAEDEGSICIYRRISKQGSAHLDIYLAPIPMNTSVLHRCIERANDYNHDRSARVLRIDESDAEAIASSRISVRKRREQYIFDPKKYSELRGKALYTVRRNVSRILKNEDVRLETYNPTFADDCHTLLESWRIKHREQHGTAGGYGSSKRIIDLAGRLPESALTGQVVLINDKVCAFSFGGNIHSKLACSYERKCDNGINGLTYYQLRSLLLHLNQYERVNDGSDAGRPGLKQLKDSFRPIAMHAEYRGYQSK
jgi:hypothetical protein